ncbi:bacillopeptidase F [Peribacillus simplex]|uniref:S8 family peptidase n=1 Tax=Peribacillus simplex TaxID=1478 RepID=UPI0024E1A8B6|nr:S8 family peptidase [Peribacillus simplex]MDF9761719.1 bacillopeptidase F [Peribacillus simplex]
MKKKKVKKLANSFFSVVIFGSLLLPGMATAAVKESPSVSIQQNAKQSTSIQNKITKSVKNQFNKEDKVTFLVKFNKQANPKKAANAAEKKAKSNVLTAAKTEYQKRSAVVTSLRMVADETQNNLKTYLKQQKKKGNVEKINSFYIVNGMSVRATKEVMEKIAQFSEVEKILPNEKIKLNKQLPQSVNTQNQQTVTPATEGVEWNIKQIDAPSAWKLGYDGTGTVVATIDSGVEWNHPALKEKYRGYDPEHPNNPTNEFNWYDAVGGESEPYDDVDHGTHVTGTMVGSESSGTNQIGVAPGAKWIAVKAFSEYGGTYESLLKAGEWILAPKDAEGNPHPEMAPDVVNNSWSGQSGIDEWYRDIVKAWKAADIFPEFSAGNGIVKPGSIANPANYPESFATGATDSNNILANFSLQGPSPYNEVKPEITAPGANIRSSIPRKEYKGGWNGTSMAAPHVSGVVALLKQANSSLTVDELEKVLMDTATPLTDSTFPTSPNNGYGYGLVNAFKAVKVVAEGFGKVKGQVFLDGNDKEAPTFKHESVTEVFEGAELPLSIKVEDNLRIASVKLVYKMKGSDWKTIDARRTSGDFKKGTYQVTIPVLEGPLLSYKWTAEDLGGNKTDSKVNKVPISPRITSGYYQDFETFPNGWSRSNDRWQWGAPKAGTKYAASGEKIFGVNLLGRYDVGIHMDLFMPPIQVPNEGEFYLQFKHSHELEEPWWENFRRVYVIPEGETKEVLVGDFSKRTSGWTDGEINLSSYKGQKIRVFFNMSIPEDSIAVDGWDIDDVKLSGTSNKTATKSKLETKKSVHDKKELVDLKKLEPITTTKKISAKENEKLPSSQLPLKAQISMMGTSKSTYSDPATGQYAMTQSPGKYTIKAEAYGYESKMETVEVKSDQTIDVNFALKELKKHTLLGFVKNEETGKPISNASIYLIEDAAVQPVKTTHNGKYSLSAYKGSYTVRISAEGYHSKEITVDLKGDIIQNVKLKPYIGYSEEIGYDNGTAENTRVFNEAGNRWAVKMSLKKGQTTAMLKGGLFKFWNTEWPVQSGTDFKVEVYDATGEQGAPGKTIAGPFIGKTTNTVDGWTKVDLGSEGIKVNQDFYLVYVQTQSREGAPFLATDEDGTYSERNWQLVNKSWSQTPKEEGNYMIRTIVDYELPVPVITSPKD